jgi:DNA-binding transcriptional LysR family regulator
MQINQIRCFVAVAEHKSITKAAKALYVTQSAVSQTISHLERELDASLFVKSGSGMELSSVGKKVLLNAETILEQIEAIKTVCASSQPKNLRVRLAAPVLPHQVSALVRDFHKSGHSIDIVRQPNHTGIAEIRIDSTVSESFNDRRVRLFTEEIALVVPKYHRLYDSGVVELRELEPFPIISLNGYCGLRPIEDYFCNLAGFLPQREQEAASLEEFTDMVVSGAGIAFYPMKLWEIETIEIERIVRIASPRCYRYIYAEQQASAGADYSAIQTVFDFILEWFRKY